MDDDSSLRDPGFDEGAASAARELHYGRLDALAHHIRHSDFRIHPIVAKKILQLLENRFEQDEAVPYCLFELKAVRLSGVAAAHRDPQLAEMRNFDMAIQVARKCRFKRGHLLRACAEVGAPQGLKAEYVRNLIAPYRERAMEAVEEEQLQAAYERGEIDIFGRPICE